MALGILIAIFLVLIGLAGKAAAPGQQKLGMVAFPLIAALSPFIYGVIGLVAGAVEALLYNWIASVIGGIEMELETMATVQVPPPSSAASPVCSPHELSAHLEAFYVSPGAGGGRLEASIMGVSPPSSSVRG